MAKKHVEEEGHILPEVQDPSRSSVSNPEVLAPDQKFFSAQRRHGEVHDPEDDRFADGED